MSNEPMLFPIEDDASNGSGEWAPALENGTHSVRMIVVGGGKGGVGKSLLAANLGIYLSQIGKRTILVDLDLGGANLHTFVGVDRPRVTLGDLFRKRVSGLEECVVDTSIKHLGLISAEGDPLWAADPSPTIKRRLFHGLKKLDVDFLICDLPAGSGFMALDFFCSAYKGILVIAPEPTSAENAYRFMKSAFLRRVRMLRPADTTGPTLGTLVDQLELMDHSEGGIPAPLDVYQALLSGYPAYAALVEQEIRTFRPAIVVNQARSRADIQLGEHMRLAGSRRLGFPIDYLGHIDSDDAVWQAVRKRRPLLTAYPDSKAASQIEKLARRLLSDEEHDGEVYLKPLEQQNFYEVLEVDPGASDEEIRRAVRYLRDIYALDSMIRVGLYNSARLHALHRRIDEASDTLLDAERRRRYDMLLFPEGVPVRAEKADRLKKSVPSKKEAQAASVLANRPSVGVDTVFSGDLLKQVRESMGLDLTEIADRTKIGMGPLRAIEMDQRELFPAPVYLRGFLIEYARSLNLDPIQVSKTYMARFSL